MTAKQGILHDYDLKANEEKSAQGNTCIVCGANPTVYQWSDYSGEGMCTRCGCPYQLKWGSDEQQEVGNYPYLNLKSEWVHVVKSYWSQTHCFTYLGSGIGNRPGLKEFYDWVDENGMMPTEAHAVQTW